MTKQNILTTAVNHIRQLQVVPSSALPLPLLTLLKL